MMTYRKHLLERVRAAEWEEFPTAEQILYNTNFGCRNLYGYDQTVSYCNSNKKLLMENYRFESLEGAQYKITDFSMCWDMEMLEVDRRKFGVEDVQPIKGVSDEEFMRMIRG